MTVLHGIGSSGPRSDGQESFLRGTTGAPHNPAALVSLPLVHSLSTSRVTLPARCSSAVRNGLLLLNLLLCNHHTLGEQLITQELRDTLFRHSGIAPGTEPMPTTRTILMMLLNRYSEPRGSPERAGTVVDVLPTNDMCPAGTSQFFTEGYRNLPEMNETLSVQARHFFRVGGSVLCMRLCGPG